MVSAMYNVHSIIVLQYRGENVGESLGIVQSQLLVVVLRLL